jgi:hypothetical protein
MLFNLQGVYTPTYRLQMIVSATSLGKNFNLQSGGCSTSIHANYVKYKSITQTDFIDSK